MLLLEIGYQSYTKCAWRVLVLFHLQILYATEGENKKTEDREEPAAGVLQYKGHDFLQIHYRTPTNCESCNKTLWHMIHPPTALECRSKSSIQLSH